MLQHSRNPNKQGSSGVDGGSRSRGNGMGAKYNEERRRILEQLSHALGLKAVLWCEWNRDGRKPSCVVLHDGWEDAPSSVPHFIERTGRPLTTWFRAKDGSRVRVVTMAEARELLPRLKATEQSRLKQEVNRKKAVAVRNEVRSKQAAAESLPPARPRRPRRDSTASLYLRHPNLGLLDDDHTLPGE